VIFNELASFYAGHAALAKPLPYRNYIAWTLNRPHDEAHDFWREYLKDLVPQTLRIGQRPAAVKVPARRRGRGGNTREDVTRRCRNVAKENQITLNTLLQGSWALCWHIIKPRAMSFLERVFWPADGAIRY